MTEPTRVPRSLPRGRSSLPREVVLVSQRARLIEAAIEVVGARGYAATTVGDIIKRAGVSRTTFYEQFADKEDCFIAAYEERARSHLGRVVRECGRVRSPLARLQTGVRTFLDVLAGDLVYARVFLIEALAAGPRAATVRAGVQDQYAELVRAWHADVRAENELVPPMPDELFECAVGGVADFLARRVLAGELDRLPASAPLLVTFLLNLAAVPAGRDLAAALAASRRPAP